MIMVFRKYQSEEYHQSKTDSLGRKWISWVDTPQTDLKKMNVAGKIKVCFCWRNR